MPKKVSLKAIAEASGVSISAVSQILNNRECNYCAENTKMLVRETARRLGFRQDYGSRILRGEKTGTVAIAVYENTLNNEDHIRRLVSTLLIILNSRHIPSYVIPTVLNAEGNIKRVDDLLQRGIDSFIFIGDPMGHEDIISRILAKKRSYVSFGTCCQRRVDIDASGSLAELIGFLEKETDGNFRFMLPPDKDAINNERTKALLKYYPELDFNQIMERFRLPYVHRASGRNAAEEWFKCGYELTKSALAADSSIRGIFYTSDIFALGGVKYLSENSIIAGRDFHVAGFNNTDAVCFNARSISSISYNITKIAETIADCCFFEEEYFVKMVKTTLHLRKEVRS